MLWTSAPHLYKSKHFAKTGSGFTPLLMEESESKDV